MELPFVKDVKEVLTLHAELSKILLTLNFLSQFPTSPALQPSLWPPPYLT